MKLTYRKKRKAKPSYKITLLKYSMILFSGFCYGILFETWLAGDSYDASEVAAIVQIAEDNARGACPLNQEQIAQMSHFETVILGGLK